jgi:hypothetical protein
LDNFETSASFMKPLGHFGRRYAVAVWLALSLCAVSLLTRCALAFRDDVTGGVLERAGAFAIGTLYDLIAAAFALAPLVFWLAVLPNRVARWRLHRLLLSLGISVTVFSLLLNAVSE